MQPFYRTSAAQRRRSGTRVATGRAVFVATTLVALIVLTAFLAFRAQAPDTFLDVTVNGIPLGGCTFSEGVQRVRDMADQRLNKNVIRLHAGEKSWSLTPSMLGASMDVDSQLALAWNFGHTGNFFQRKAQRDYLQKNAVAFSSALSYDEQKLDDFVAEIKSQIDVPPVDATITLEGEGKFLITESADGLSLDGVELKEALKRVIVEGSAPEIHLVSQPVKPGITAESLREGTELIGSCTTSTETSSADRVSNIKRALTPFNGFAVHPGDTVSVNKVVKKRTVENGYREAPEFAGTSIQMGIGGGVCQASSTLYKALLRAGMTVEQRWQHNMTVSYIDPSLDATINNNDKDLVFTNNRDCTVYIFTSVSRKSAQVKVYGKRPEFKIEPVGEIIQDNIQSTEVRKKKDKSGKRAYYTDDRVLESEGKTGRRSRAMLYYYDWETGEQVGQPDELHVDYYYPSPPVYWVGIHEREEIEAVFQ
jgi:vancomycin resistance protein YoaR